jgi:hypothetical protein
MHAPQVFEYAIVRVVPRAEREEFVNVGVILFCKRKKFLGSRFHIDEVKLKALSDKIDIEEIRKYLNAFESICRGDKVGGPIAELEIAERFRWLAASRSTIIQTSKTHSGLCEEPLNSLERIFKEMVL